MLLSLFFLLRHLDYFEMLRNDDELTLSRRFESVSRLKIITIIMFLYFMYRYIVYNYDYIITI